MPGQPQETQRSAEGNVGRVARPSATDMGDGTQSWDRHAAVAVRCLPEHVSTACGTSLAGARTSSTPAFHTPSTLMCRAVLGVFTCKLRASGLFAEFSAIASLHRLLVSSTIPQQNIFVVDFSLCQFYAPCQDMCVEMQVTPGGE